MNNEEKVTRYLRKIAENTDRIARALEARYYPNQRRNVKETKSLDEQIDELNEALRFAGAISEDAVTKEGDE